MAVGLAKKNTQPSLAGAWAELAICLKKSFGILIVVCKT